MKVFAVKTIFNTYEDNQPVPDDVPEDEMPTVYHGPFESLEAAKNWQENVYPDDDTDVYEQYYGEFEIKELWLNDPESLYSE